MARLLGKRYFVIIPADVYTRGGGGINSIFHACTSGEQVARRVLSRRIKINTQKWRVREVVSDIYKYARARARGRERETVQ